MTEDQRQTAEAKYLQQSLGTTKPLTAREELIARSEACTATCNFVNLQQGQLFIYEGEKWRATGDIFVCKKTKKVHMCGLRCTYIVIIPPSFNSTCSLTGNEIAQAMCLARNRSDRRVLEVGLDIICDYVPSRKEDGVTESQALKSAAELYDNLEGDFESNANRVLASTLGTLEYYHPPSASSTVSKKHGRYEDGDDEKDDEAYKRTPSDRSRLLHAAMNNDVLMLEMMRKYRTHNTDYIEEKIIERLELKRHASRIWEYRAMRNVHIRHMEINVKKATLEWLKCVDAYYKECIKSKQMIDKLHVLTMFTHFVWGEFEGMFYGMDIDALNQQSRTYYIDCLVKTWEKYQEAPIVAKGTIQFVMCATAILTAFHTGFFINVFFTAKDPKPKIWGNLTFSEQKHATSIKLAFIDPHPNLILTPFDVIKEMEESGPAQDIELVLPDADKKPVFSKMRGNSRKGPNKHAQIVPNLKKFNNVVEDIVQHCPTIEVLREFCLSSIYPKQNVPAYILRK